MVQYKVRAPRTRRAKDVIPSGGSSAAKTPNHRQQATKVNKLNQDLVVRWKSFENTKHQACPIRKTLKKS